MTVPKAPNTLHQSGVRIPPPVIYAVVFGSGYLLQKYFPLNPLPDLISKASAIICSAVAIFIGAWSFLRFWRARTSPLPIHPTTAIVTDGPYKFTRNPMYLALALVYVACALWFDIFWSLVLLPVLIAVVQNYIIAGEERYLVQKFGAEYLRYKKQVRRWL